MYRMLLCVFNRHGSSMFSCRSNYNDFILWVRFSYAYRIYFENEISLIHLILYMLHYYRKTDRRDIEFSGFFVAIPVLCIGLTFISVSLGLSFVVLCVYRHSSSTDNTGVVHQVCCKRLINLILK